MKRTASGFRPLLGLMFLRTIAPPEPLLSTGSCSDGNLRVTIA